MYNMRDTWSGEGWEGWFPYSALCLGCRLRGSLPVVVAATIAGAPIPTLSSSVSTTGMNICYMCCGRVWRARSRTDGVAVPGSRQCPVEAVHHRLSFHLREGRGGRVHRRHTRWGRGGFISVCRRAEGIHFCETDVPVPSHSQLSDCIFPSSLLNVPVPPAPPPLRRLAGIPGPPRRQEEC